MQADSLVYQTEKQLKELGDKVPAEVKSKVEAKVSELKEVAGKDDVEGTKKAIDELQKEVGELPSSLHEESLRLLSRLRLPLYTCVSGPSESSHAVRPLWFCACQSDLLTMIQYSLPCPPLMLGSRCSQI